MNDLREKNGHEPISFDHLKKYRKEAQKQQQIEKEEKVKKAKSKSKSPSSSKRSKSKASDIKVKRKGGEEPEGSISPKVTITPILDRREEDEKAADEYSSSSNASD